MIPSDAEKVALKSPVDAPDSSDMQSVPLLAVSAQASAPTVKSPRPGASADAKSEPAPEAGNVTKHSRRTANKSKELPESKEPPASINLEELQKQMRQKVEQILKKSCDQAADHIMQSLQQLAGVSAPASAGSSAPASGDQVKVVGSGQHPHPHHEVKVVGSGQHPHPHHDGKAVGFSASTKVGEEHQESLPRNEAGLEGSWGFRMCNSASIDTLPAPAIVGNECRHSEEEEEHIWERCHACGNRYQPDAMFCRKCGIKRENFAPAESRIQCPNCGNQYHHDALFCRKCGMRREHFYKAKKKGGTPYHSPFKKSHARNSRKSYGRRSHSPMFGAQKSDGVNEEDDGMMAQKPRGIFANSDDMKRQLREAIAQPDYDVARFYHKEGYCQAIATSTLFEHITLFVIAFNALWISIDCDHNEATVLVDADPVFQVVDNLFCLYFVFEWGVRFGAFRRKRDGLKDGWFMFDSIMVLIMALETWVMSLMILAYSRRSTGGSDQSDSGVADASLLKIVRLVRLVRMARVIRILNALPELMVLIKGMFVAARAVSCTVTLMLIIIYIFAVTFRQLTSDSEFGRRRFPSVPVTMRYLLLQSCVPDMYDASEEIWEEGWFYALLFLFFLLIVTITVMNMLVGVLVSVVNTVASVEKEQLMVNFVKTNVLALLRQLSAAEEDHNFDGHITLNQFKALMNIPEALRSFDSMGVDVVGLDSLKDFIFGDGAPIPFADFMELVMQLRGSNQATVKDIVDLRKFILIEHKRLEKVISKPNHAGDSVDKVKSTTSSGGNKGLKDAGKPPCMQTLLQIQPDITGLASNGASPATEVVSAGASFVDKSASKPKDDAAAEEKKSKSKQLKPGEKKEKKPSNQPPIE